MRSSLCLGLLLSLSLPGMLQLPGLGAVPSDRPVEKTEDQEAYRLEQQAGLLYRSGQREEALQLWQQAAERFATSHDLASVSRVNINEAQVWQELGFYRRSIEILDRVNQNLTNEPDSVMKVVGLRRLGDGLLVMGELERADNTLQQALSIATRLGATEEISATQLSLGNAAQTTAREIQNRSPRSQTRPIQSALTQALKFYQQAGAEGNPLETRVQAQISEISLRMEQKQWSEAQALWPMIWSELGGLPFGRVKIYSALRLVRSLSQMVQAEQPLALTDADLINLLQQSQQQAQALGDRRAESSVLGTLGAYYQQKQQWSIAQGFTQQALLIAQGSQLPELSYRWHWQLGELLKTQGQDQAAIAAYDSAVQILTSLRGDLAAMKTEAQFSFQAEIEPVYRQFVDLLLRGQDDQVSQDNLEKARATIEALKVAELDNFFRSACLDATPVNVDAVDPQAAVFYPIVLPDRLAVVVQLPGQSFRYYSPGGVTKEIVEMTVRNLQATVSQASTNRYLPEAQKLYNWLIRPIEADLATSGAKTLVFVPDGVLQNVPFGVLQDGQHYLIEQYEVAVTPGLQLLSAYPLKSRQLGVLALGLSKSRHDQPTLPAVEVEMQGIQQLFKHNHVLLNEQFTSTALETAIERESFPIVHLATHGQFSSNLAGTFLLAWDGKIQIDALRQILEAVELNRSKPIELLVLSACETAAGDDRAALGLAGVAARSGARSTLATLWQVHDSTTAEFMAAFYQALLKPGTTKAAALQQAQLSILRGSGDKPHPYFWAAYVLVGNWL
jgi:CHAT domain-containing protein